MVVATVFTGRSQVYFAPKQLDLYQQAIAGRRMAEAEMSGWRPVIAPPESACTGARVRKRYIAGARDGRTGRLDVEAG